MRHSVFGVVLSCLSSCAASVTGSVITDPSDGLASYEHRMFTTEADYAPSDLGVAGVNADGLCMTSAQAAGLTRTYRAILASSNRTPATFLRSNGAVYIFDSSGTRRLVANSLTALWDAGTTALQSTLSYDQFGAGPGSQLVWTGSNSNGTYHPTSNCADWSSSVAGPTGRIGRPSDVDGQWIDRANLPCNFSARLYCISQ